MQIIRDKSEFRKVLGQWDTDPTISGIGHFPFGRYYAYHEGHDHYFEWVKSHNDKVIAFCLPQEQQPYIWHPEHIAKLNDNALSPDFYLPEPTMGITKDDIMVSDGDLQTFENRFGQYVDLCYAPPMDKDSYNQIVSDIYADTSYINWIKNTFEEFHWSKIMHMRYICLMKDEAYKNIDSKVTCYFAIKDSLMKRGLLLAMQWLKDNGFGVDTPPRKRVFAPLFRDQDELIPERDPMTQEIKECRLRIHNAMHGWAGTDSLDLNTTIHQAADPIPVNCKLKNVQIWNMKSLKLVDKLNSEKLMTRIVLNNQLTEEVWEDYRYFNIDETKSHDMITLEEI